VLGLPAGVTLPGPPTGWSVEDAIAHGVPLALTESSFMLLIDWMNQFCMFIQSIAPEGNRGMSIKARVALTILFLAPMGVVSQTTHEAKRDSLVIRSLEARAKG
jgi:hypothetical protein